MWGYEYDEQKKQQRKKTAVSMLIGLVMVGIAAWLASGYFSISGPDRQLLSAARSGDLGELYSALENGANPNVIGPNGRTPLHLAAWHGQRSAARALLSSGANPNQTDDETGETPLHTAVRANQPDMVVILMSGGARSSARILFESAPDIDGNRHPPGVTARDMAERAGFDQVTRIFKGG
ncbi:ankyrin repeat domain-containing protein [Wenzhouxiangella sp. XN201]|uniref:ankyrin repeat domain-containing protein n=1 Tax=Wenzhouxiangella sp. XN201 TaxID=2710755 RepID=UPI0013C707F7|nr:ankyrin repeat domain-containing protein [Wenzhouxiangella sp. XN201]NEZ03425.1 ankyrin repeat domain-containing protein [Wenzhouxiangella sp. XN201]